MRRLFLLLLLLIGCSGTRWTTTFRPSGALEGPAEIVVVRAATDIYVVEAFEQALRARNFTVKRLVAPETEITAVNATSAVAYNKAAVRYVAELRSSTYGNSLWINLQLVDTAKNETIYSGDGRGQYQHLLERVADTLVAVWNGEEDPQAIADREAELTWKRPDGGTRDRRESERERWGLSPRGDH